MSKSIDRNTEITYSLKNPSNYSLNKPSSKDNSKHICVMKIMGPYILARKCKHFGRFTNVFYKMPDAAFLDELLVDMAVYDVELRRLLDKKPKESTAEQLKQVIYVLNRRLKHETTTNALVRDLLTILKDERPSLGHEYDEDTDKDAW